MMNQEALFKKLGTILNELNDQYQYLAQNPEQLSELELELFLANSNFLSDHIQIIKKLNLPLIATQSRSAKTQRQVEQQEAVAIFADHMVAEEPELTLISTNDVVLEPQPEQDQTVNTFFETEELPAPTFEFILNTGDYAEDDKFDFEEKSADELFDRTLSKEEELIIAAKRKVSMVAVVEDLEDDEIGPEPFLVHKEDAVSKPVVKAPIIEIPARVISQTVTIETTKIEVETEYKPTLNDMLSQGSNSTRLNETSGPAVGDLKTAINLNDKLLYIKDLFNGYNLAYAEAIDIINKMPNFDAADNFLQKNYASSNNWSENQATVDKFYVLLNRRFK